jgi:hypothetical protein
MTHAYIIQFAGLTAGIVARDHAGQAFHFFASSPAYRLLEGVSFQAPEQAQRAARKIHGARPKAKKIPKSHRA